MCCGEEILNSDQRLLKLLILADLCTVGIPRLSNMNLC